jgi:hypothetical protein
MIRQPVRTILVSVAAVAAASLLATGCRSREAPAPPVATPSIVVNHPEAPLGGPIEITYRFKVADDAQFAEDYHVMLHVVDTDEELMWTDDHSPPIPTTQWKPGQPIEYTRTVFVPIYPYIGDASLQVGLYSLRTQKRLPLVGEDAGHRAYTVGRLHLLPQTENVFIVFKDGWHPAEMAEGNASVEWQWTKKDATLAFRNPRKVGLFYLDVDGPGGVFQEEQAVQISLGNQVVDRFTLKPNERLLRKIPLDAAQLGAADFVELQIGVDKTFVPALLNPSGSKDTRELGVRVFHASVDTRVPSGG